MITMRGRTLGIVAVLLIGLTLSGVPARGESSSTTDQANDEAHFVELINGERIKAGLGPLTVVPELVGVGREWSAVMLTKSANSDPCIVSHNPDFSAKVTADWRRLGENVGCGNVDAEYLHQRFVESPPHLRNILDPSFDSVGIGIVYDGDVMFVTEQFMDRRESAATGVPSVLALAPKATAKKTSTRAAKKVRRT